MRRFETLAILAGCAVTCLLAPADAWGAGYLQTNLVSDGFVPALNSNDQDLKNPWGIALSSGSPFWVADNGAGVSTLYNGAGTKQTTRVTIPPPSVTPTATAAPTGAVFNGTTDFQVATGKAATFIFATEDGTISGWNNTVNSSTAVLKVDNPNVTSGSVYKGLTMGSTAAGNFLYASNFRMGHVDVFDKNYAPASGFAFTDPNLPAPAAGTPGYAPFGIQAIGGKVYVTYALQDATQHDDVHTLGNGFVDVFDTSGNPAGPNGSPRLITGGVLDSPWGIAMAPATFGQFAGDLLVGNFGNSRVNAFNPATGAFLGTLTDANGQPLSLSDAPGADGLWGITFGNDKNGGSSSVLYFTSGVNDEADGLFGSVSVPEPGAATLAGFAFSGLLSSRRRRG